MLVVIPTMNSAKISNGIKVGSVLGLYYSPSTGRTANRSFELDAKGIIEDKHYDKDINKSVLITSLESYELAKSNGIDASYGLLGENILIDYNPYHLGAGSKLIIGEVTLEISQGCTLCKSLTNIDSRLPKLLKDDRGIFAKVLDAGNIKNGDTVYLVD